MGEILTVKFTDDEIIKEVDMSWIAERQQANPETLLYEIVARDSTNDIIIEGLEVVERGTPSMNIDITTGIGINISTGNMAHTGSTIGPVSIDNGDGSDRIDIIEARLATEDYNSEQRAFKDPSTGLVTYTNVYTKTRYYLEAQVIKGTAGSGVAPAHTSGWIKLAEITVPAGESTEITDSDIENCDGGYDGEASTGWTLETAATYRLQSLSNIKNIIRTSIKENGDLYDDIIKDKHIDWGTSTNQVSAEDIPS